MTWQHWAVVYRSATDRELFLNGVAQGSVQTTSYAQQGFNDVGFGGLYRSSPIELMDGFADEVRVMSHDPASDTGDTDTAHWALAVFTNQNAPGTFLTIGAEE